MLVAEPKIPVIAMRGPRVRIHLPPAGSQRTFGSSRTRRIRLGQNANNRARYKRSENQVHRTRVREVRIQFPPAERCYGAGGEDGNFVAYINRWSAAMSQPNDLSRSLVALDQDSTIIAVVEMSQSSWLVGGVLPGIERQPRKKLEPSPERLLALLHRWRDESVRAGRTITRIAVTFEAGR